MKSKQLLSKGLFVLFDPVAPVNGAAGLFFDSCGSLRFFCLAPHPYIIRFLRMENLTMAIALMELSGTSIGSWWGL